RYFDVYRKIGLVEQSDATAVRVEPWQMLAPVSDSIWRFQNSPWGKYKVMWAEGFHDYFWLERLGDRYRSRAHHVMSLLKADDKSDSSSTARVSPPSGKKP
ncbi:hypothetical protein FJY63_10680, partial [Candidatus Sumerlaeota bacterium]|nr:hypothetical protein [Candidatus Sumerlaeota bacterium]